MKKKYLYFLSILLSLCMGVTAANAVVISGSITDLPEGSTVTFGDSSNHITMFWTVNTYDKGWFYGSAHSLSLDSDVGYASGISDISQITDASIFSLSSTSTGPHCDADCANNNVGDFLVWRNVITGYYGVLRIDDIFAPDPPYGTLDATWWFQTDGSGDFSAVPLPTAIYLFGSGLLGLIGISKCKYAA